MLARFINDDRADIMSGYMVNADASIMTLHNVNLKLRLTPDNESGNQ